MLSQSEIYAREVKILVAFLVGLKKTVIQMLSLAPCLHPLGLDADIVSLSQVTAPGVQARIPLSEIRVRNAQLLLDIPTPLAVLHEVVLLTVIRCTRLDGVGSLGGCGRPCRRDRAPRGANTSAVVWVQVSAVSL